MSEGEPIEDPAHQGNWRGHQAAGREDYSDEENGLGHTSSVDVELQCVQAVVLMPHLHKLWESYRRSVLALDGCMPACESRNLRNS